MALPDESDLIAECQSLDLRAKSLRAELANCGEIVAEPPIKDTSIYDTRGDGTKVVKYNMWFFDKLEMLHAHVPDLEARLAAHKSKAVKAAPSPLAATAFAATSKIVASARRLYVDEEAAEFLKAYPAYEGRLPTFAVQ